MLDSYGTHFVVKLLCSFEERNSGDGCHGFGKPWGGVTMKKLVTKVGKPLKLFLIPFLSEAGQEFSATSAWSCCCAGLDLEH